MNGSPSGKDDDQPYPSDRERDLKLACRLLEEVLAILDSHGQVVAAVHLATALDQLKEA